MLEIGKLDSQLLEKIVFDKIKYKRPEVEVRPSIGEDCAEINFGEYNCIVSTDPITAAVEEIGSLAIHISCNDIASNGVAPLGIMLTVMLPEGTTENDVAKIMQQAGEEAAKLKVEIIGGHTEVTRAVAKPVIVSTAIGRKLNTKKEPPKMKSGDGIIMTKFAGIEGVGIIASDFAEELKDTLTKKEVAKARGFLKQVSVVEEGVTAGEIGVCQMHDITEGGVLGAVWEVCRVGKVGAVINEKKIPMNKLVKKVSEKFDINPHRLISSGCMLIVAPKAKVEEIIVKIRKKGIDACQIGEIQASENGILLDGAAIEPPGGDEIYKVVMK